MQIIFENDLLNAEYAPINSNKNLEMTSSIVFNIIFKHCLLSMLFLLLIWTFIIFKESTLIPLFVIQIFVLKLTVKILKQHP